MKLIIHRGAREIGGSCVELSAGKTRILVDLGVPSVSDKKKPFNSKILAGKSLEDLKKLNILPGVQGLYAGEEKAIDAILISHSPMGHYGFLKYTHPDIPIYASRGAKILIEISNIFLPHTTGDLNIRTVQYGRAFKVGDLTVTPYFVDHSAFDALAYLIAAEDTRLFYSGDFRGHSRMSVLFDRMLSNPPENIDCLLMEGSMIGGGKQAYKDEAAVQTKIEDILKSSDTIAFFFAPSQNIDLIVSAYKACLKTGRIFVIDIYTAYILDKLRKVSENIPQFNWNNVRVKFQKDQADTLAKKVSTQTLYYYNTRKIDAFELEKKKDRVLLFAGDNSVFPSLVKSLGDVKGARIIYSMWKGYLTDTFKEYCKDKGLEIEQVHTSGHATVEDLRSFAEALDPKTLIPIHTFGAEQYEKIFKNVTMIQDKKPYFI
ncbi:MAG: MBL fold metallo-hydrolase [Candidatus Omnitrophota bacterium]